MVENEPRGAFVDGAHVLRLRVYYEDTDAAGIVYYANYLKFAERARTEMLRDLGVENSQLMNGDGLAFAVRHCSADYLKPARLDDLLDVHTRLLEVGGASLIVEQRIIRQAEELVRLKLRLACLNRSYRPARLPADVRASMVNLCAANQLD